MPTGVAERERGVHADAEAAAGSANRRPIQRLDTVVLLSGAVGAGKSTVARIVARRFERGVHLDMDVVLNHFVVSGLNNDPEQIQLGLRNAAALAANFHDNGYAVIMEGAVPDRHSLDTLRTCLAPRQLTLVVLAPPVSVSVERDRTRGGKSVAHLFGHLDAQMRTELANEGAWLDTAALTPAQTAEHVLTLLRPA
ncbi:adenylyl-sulfate kinase [Lentzea sp. NBRC 105346]|uniref:adenylyl-sulfate kinase n=1 Tax=Lentzea sp. NBRC 105346 TaxID=3032205 RepID=UPI002553DAAF|nr:adenylyl-sulfate kinase [Lentzea sp. NBRC 105346]